MPEILQAGMHTAALFGAIGLAPPVEVHRRGSACEDAALDARIAHYLQASTAGDEAATTVDAELSREDDLWRLDLRVPADGDVRTFRAAACGTVIDAAAFVVAVAIDPTVADAIDGPELSDLQREPDAPGDEPTGAEAPRIAEPPATDDTETATPRGTAAPGARSDREPAQAPSDGPTDAERDRSSRPRRAPAIALGASGGIQGGALPRVGALVRVEIGLLGRRWRADARGQVRTPSRAEVGSAPGVGGRVGAWSIGARGCGLPVVRVPGLDVPLCAGVEAGEVFAQGYGFDAARSARLRWAAVTVGPALTFAVVPALALIVGAEAGVSLLGGELVIDGLGSVHRVGSVFGRGFVGLEARFGGTRGRRRAP